MVESRRIDRTLDPNADREDILAKFIFTLVYGFVGSFGPNIHYHVFIDSPDGDEGPSISVLCALNNKAKSQLGYEDRPFKSVKFVRSEKSRLIQATDLLTGAVAYETNSEHLSPSASAHRKALWAEMLAASKLATFAAQTKFWPKTFQIQHFDFSRTMARELSAR